MKDLLSKEDYCSKIDVLQMKKSPYHPSSIDNPLIWITLPIFTKNLDTILLWFFKNLNTPINRWALTRVQISKPLCTISLHREKE